MRKVTGHALLVLQLYQHPEDDNSDEEAWKVGAANHVFVEYAGNSGDFETRLLDAIYDAGAASQQEESDDE